MKNSRKLAAFVASILAVACMAAPMATSFSADAAGEGSITITNKDTATHTYAAYQIFSGNYTGGVLTNIEWGDGVNGTELLSALKSDNTLKTYFSSCETASDVADALGAKNSENAAVFEDDKDLANAFAQLVGQNLKETTSGTYGEGKITGLTDGYYLVKDTTTDTIDGAKTRFIVEVVGGADVAVYPKSAKPTVDKQVQDEAGDKEDGADDNGWGESADHAINEQFQFKLTATLPNDTEFDKYKEYKVIFNDTMSAGVTYDGIASVTVDDQPIDETGYTVTGVNAGEAGKTWTLTIANIKSVTGVDLTDGAEVIVTYNAHLNEDAVVSSANGDSLGVADTNNNMVKLQYSNNPNVGGEGELGETTEDYVWVFTYESDNQKVDENKAPLTGAEFKLYSDSACSEANEIKLYQKTEGSTEYYPIGNATDKTPVAMSSGGTDSKFQIKGLDAGTYYLKETKTPDGYNTLAEPITITISATHKENEGGANVKLSDLSTPKSQGEDALQIENKKGTGLPSTGGIGTTIFYVAGGALVVGAGVLLVSKKRMSNK